MKQLCWLLLILSLISSCSAQKADRKFEACLTQSFQDRNQDYLVVINSSEEQLIGLGLLKDHNGTSYMTLAQELRDKNTLGPLYPPQVHTILTEDSLWKQCFLNQQDLPTGIATRGSLVMDSLDHLQDISPARVMELILNNFNAKDFDSPIGKHYFYLMCYANYYEPGILVKLPPWSDEEPDVTKLKARNVFSVLVNGKDELLVRGELTDIKQLRAKTKLFISNPTKDPSLAENPKKAIISLKNDRDTNYKVYLAVYNELKAAYLELWNDYSQAKFGRPYSDDLPFALKKEIRDAIPFIISEAEPSNW